VICTLRYAIGLTILYETIHHRPILAESLNQKAFHLTNWSHREITATKCRLASYIQLRACWAVDSQSTKIESRWEISREVEFLRIDGYFFHLVHIWDNSSAYIEIFHICTTPQTEKRQFLSLRSTYLLVFFLTSWLTTYVPTFPYVSNSGIFALLHLFKRINNKKF